MSGSRSFALPIGGETSTGAQAKADAAQAYAIQRVNHTGTQSADTLTDGTTNKAFLATERTKLAGVATGATANQPDWTTQSKSASFSAAAGFFYLVDSTSGAVTMTMPAASTAGQLVAVKWDAGSSAVVVQRAGSDTIGLSATTATIGLAGEVWEFVSSGSGVWNLVAGNKTLASLDSRYLPNSLTTGEVVPARDRILNNTVGTVTGVLHLTYFTADKTEAINTLTMASGATAAAATPTLCRMGIYSVATNGDLALVASTANDTTLFASTNTAYAKALSATWNKVAGTRYAAALIIVSGATMPTMHGLSLAGTSFTNTLVRLSPAIAGRLTSQSDLPPTVTVGSLVGYQALFATQMT